MEKNEEIKQLREQITRLRVRLNELDADKANEPATEVCGHDFLLDHLKKLGGQYNQKGRCVLAGYHNDYWYTTTIEPSKIRAFLEDSKPVKVFLSLFCNESLWDGLASSFEGKADKIKPEVYKLLEQNGLVSGNVLTVKGFTCYAVLGHLVYNMTKKLPPEKAIPIFKIAYELTGIEYGENLPYTKEEFVTMIKAHKEYAELARANISDEDIGEYIRQNNV
jgi:hypothetical protein